jgi:ATP-dependent 26S proteasome regulatory subunit
MMNATTQHIANLIRARYPIIAVQSHEERRIVRELEGIATSQGKALFTWSISSGVTQVLPAGEAKPNASLSDPGVALRHILEKFRPTDKLPGGPGAIFVLLDFHRYLENPVYCRLLRDQVAELTTRHQTIVLLSASFSFPADLEKDVVLVDYPLPGQDELSDLLERFADELPSDVVDLNGGTTLVVRALQGLTLNEAEAVLAQAVVATGRLNADVIPTILDAKAQLIRRSGALEYWAAQANYAEIGGLDLLKGWCEETELAFSEGAQEYGLEPQRGVLIVGLPGCGKSLTAKAVAGGVRPLLRLDVGALFGGLVGQSEAQTRAALKVAEAVAPAVLWLDEIEKALGSGGGEMDGGTSQRVLGTILTWMEETRAPVFIVATANDIGSLRPELIRRFSEVFFVDLPQSGERREILGIHLRKRRRDPADFDLDAVVKVTDGFTGSEIEKIVQSALRRAFADGRRAVSTEDLLAAAGEMVKLETTMSEGISAMREWAKRARPASSQQESGHKADGRRTRALELN